MSLTKRRREGGFLDGWPIDKTRTQTPLSATPMHQCNADQALLEGFAGLSTRNADLDLRITRQVRGISLRLAASQLVRFSLLIGLAQFWK